mmetsp:Transcript_28970/g.55475  ORF Transcript_28970/g.55475 Transcript_28970/m.55475 type:complete len:156 (-) Transcript_28970:405-872(-)
MAYYGRSYSPKHLRRCESPTSAKWRVQIDWEPRPNLHNVDVGPKSPVKNHSDQRRVGNFDFNQRFTDYETHCKTLSAPSKRAVDPYGVGARARVGPVPGYSRFEVAETRFHEYKPKPCVKNGLDPYRVKNNNLWSQPNKALSFRKERWTTAEKFR